MCPFPCLISIPFKLSISGKIIANKPVSKSNLNPMEGCLAKIILLSSSIMRSCETILMRSLFFVIEFNELSSILKLSCVEKRMARIILKGSSEYVISGFKGVFSTFFCKSPIPLKGSINAPKLSD